MDKKQLRKKILARRDALLLSERKEKSKTIASAIIGLEEFKKSNKVLLYASIKSEVETEEIFYEAKRLNKDIYYPRVMGKEMEFYRVDKMTEFDVSKYGISEPKPESTVVLEPRDEDVIFVLMPGAVFDEVGNRIGYGGGYYDKYMEWLSNRVECGSVSKVAIIYECQLVETGLIEKEIHDVQADCIVTEERIYRCEKGIE